MSSSSSVGTERIVAAQLSAEDNAGPKELPPSTFEMRPSPSECFRLAAIKELINEVLHDALQGKSYAAAKVADWVRQIADTVSVRVKELEMRRYRHVVQVMLSQQNGAGCQYIARCRWDADCDSQVTNFFSNETIVCVVSVFGVYMY